jgi:hypothetical protein
MAITEAAIQPMKVASRKVRTVSAAAVKPQKKIPLNGNLFLTAGVS